MKKIKFMLVALMAVFGFNGAMADELVNSTQYTGDGYQYKIKSLNTATNTGTVSVSQSNWATKAADKTTITIKKDIKIAVKGEVSGTPVDAEVTFDVVEIAADGFKDLADVTSVNFEAGNLTSIGAGAFAGTKIANLDLTNTKITKLNKLFEDANTTLQSVKFPATLTEVVDYALQHCYVLSTIDASASTKLVTLGKNCFGDNIVEKLDLSKTKVQALNNTPFVGKTGESGEKNKTLKELVLPNTILTLGQGLKNLYNLEKVNLEDTKITDVQSLAFENDKSLKSLKFPVTMQKVRYAAIFRGCSSLQKLTFYYDVLAEVGVGAGSYLMDEETPGDGTLSALETLEFITSDATTYNFVAAFKADAFSNLTGIKTVTIAAGDDIVSATLDANAIALSNEANSTVVLGNLKAAPTAAFIAGPTATEIAANVTIGEVVTAQAQAAGIVSGNIGTFTVGKVSAALNIDAIGQAQTIVFSGDITTALVAPATANARLTTIDFGSIKIADAADIIPASAFVSSLLTSVTWTPVIDDANPAPTALIFNQKAFGASSVNAAAKVVFTTVPEVAGLYPNNVSEPSILDPDLYNVKFVFTAVDDFAAIKVYGPADAAVYVGYFVAPAASNYYIEKKQGDATITVYSAFVDASDNKIYMDPLMIVDGKFVVEKGMVVVVRSTTKDDVKAYATADPNTMRMYGGVIVDELQFTPTAISADELGTMYYDHGQYVYYLQNPTTATGINFQILGNTQYLFANAVYIVKAGPTSSARLEVVWLGGDEATAIKAIENKFNVANDAIFNLSGQRVDASYKGVVIKNGKKYLQK